MEQRLILRNEENNYQRLANNRARAEMLGEAGRLPLLQVDQALQDELQAQDRLVQSRAGYREALDRFKIELGVPTEVNIELNEKALTDYLEQEMPVPKTSLEAALIFALHNRLDLINEAEAVSDAERKAAIAKDSLRARLDLSAGTSGSVSLRDGSSGGNAHEAGLQLELPVDRVSSPNAYRLSLITLERIKRGYASRYDLVALQVRSAWRNLEQARQSHEIEQVSLKLARQRVESVNLLLEAGRATQRDILEAQAALLRAENGMISSLISYYISYMEFLKDIEQLPIGRNGVWTGGFHEEHPG